MDGAPVRMPSAGPASASRPSTAAPPNSSGLRTTWRTSAPHTRDGRASVRRRPRNGIRPRSAHGPSRDSSAGRNVSEPMTATPTTMIVPTAIPVNRSIPVSSSPAMDTITVSPETRMARPEVAAAVASAPGKEAPAARSSRSRRR